jgi:hypothetical protein
MFQIDKGREKNQRIITAESTDQALSKWVRDDLSYVILREPWRPKDLVGERLPAPRSFAALRMTRRK